MTTAPAPVRIASLDVIRGIAVMGILVANLPAFALPHAAYFSPLAWGGSTGPDRWAWFATFVLVEGKMRGLFSVLFGASMLLVIDRAHAGGQSGARVHYARMATLAVFGTAHLYLFWWGDILLHYALVGSIAFLFAGLRVRWLLACAAALLAWQIVADALTTLTYFASAARDTPIRLATWNSFAEVFGIPPAAELAAQVTTARGGFVTGVIERWHHEASPVFVVAILGPQTLSAMLLGMAGYRSGFLTGGWERARYRRCAAACLASTLPLYVALAANTVARGFSPPWVYFASILAAEPLRPITVAGYAALTILLIRPGGWLTTRIGAVGRAAFTNYLGTTLAMTFVFSGWGLGQFGGWSRAELYLLVPVVWTAMLAWSTPWLRRYAYGPFEWAWRCLARWRIEPLHQHA